MQNRYFLVSFNFNSGCGTGYGSAETITDGWYLNEKTFIDQIKEEHKEAKIKSVAILNIIELSEQDFNQYKA